MTTLNDIPVIADNIKGASLKTVKAFYKLIFESDGDRNSRKKVREFGGFTFENESDEYEQKLLYIETNLSKSDLSVISNILKVDHDVDKSEMAKTICEKLMNLPDLKKKIESDEEDNNAEDEEERITEMAPHHDEVVSQDSYMNVSRYQMPTFTMSFRDMEDAIRPFDGTSTNPIEKWIADLEDQATILGWTELHKYVFARKSLKGLAKLFIQSESKVNTYDSLKKALLKEFSDTWTSAQVHQMLAKRKIGKNESVNEYFLKMRELASRSEMEDASLIQYVIDGITDDVQSKMILFGATSISEFKQKLKVYNEIKSKSEPRSQVLNERNTTYSVAKPSKREDKTSRCYNCGGRGHYSRDCINRGKGIKCFACQKFGHKANECEEKPPKEETKKSVCFTETVRSNGTYMQVNLGKQIINALIDTGSAVSLLKASEYVRNIQIPLENETIKLNGIGTNEIETLGKCKTVIIINDLMHEIEMYVVADTAMKPQMVIGRDFLKNYDLIISAGEVKELKRIPTSQEFDETNIMMCIQANQDDSDEICVMKNEHREEIEELIENYTPAENPKAPDVAMKQILTDESPILQRARRLAATEQREVDLIIDQRERNEATNPSTSDFASAIVPVMMIERSKFLERSKTCQTDDEHARTMKEVLQLNERYDDYVLQNELIYKMHEDDKLLAISNRMQIQEENRRSYHKARKKPKKYKEGDIVAIRRTQFTNLGKLRSRFLGPYKVVKVKRNDRYDVQKIGVDEGPKQTATAVDYMKPWNTPDEAFSEDEADEDHEGVIQVRKGRDVRLEDE